MAKKPTYEELEQRVKELQAALGDSELERTTIFDLQPYHSVIQSLDNRIIWANRAAFESVGVSREDLIGRYCYEIWPQQTYPCPDCPVIKSVQTGKPQSIEKTTPDGRKWHIRGYPIRNNRGQITRALEVTEEITERKQAVDALREREQIMKAILAASPVGIGLLHNRVLGWANSAMYRIWGYEEGFLLGKSTEVLYPDVEEYDRVGREFYSEFEEKGVGHLETRWVTKDGKEIHCYLQGSALDPSDLSKGVIVAAMDITERKRAEDLVRNLSQMLMQAQERERQMISCELHDSIAQNLSKLKIDCNLIFDDQPAISHELKVKMEKYSNLIDQTITAVRNLAYDLRPPLLDEMGLMKALLIYCEEFSENSGVKVDFQSAGIQKLNFDSNAEIHLYRLVQEGLNNIRKHAEATQANIKLMGASPNIILRIEDDGKGFDVEERARAADREKRMGLRSMAERIRLIQGEMTIQSQSMKGTQILIKFPYQEKYDSQESHIDRR